MRLGIRWLTKAKETTSIEVSAVVIPCVFVFLWLKLVQNSKKYFLRNFAKISQVYIQTSRNFKLARCGKNSGGIICQGEPIILNCW